jgi:hypothetical protein
VDRSSLDGNKSPDKPQHGENAGQGEFPLILVFDRREDILFSHVLGVGGRRRAAAGAIKLLAFYIRRSCFLLLGQ